MTKKEHYKLFLKEFEVNLSKTYRELRSDEDFCDVTLACEDKQIEAHKVILSGSSPMFKDLLKKNSHSHPLVYLLGIKYGHLINLLDFIYTGEVNITSEELDVFLSMAHELQVKGLTEEALENEEVSKSEVKQEVIQKNNEDSLEDGNSSVLSNLKQFKELVTEKDVEEQTEQSLISNEISSVSSKQKCMSDDEHVENKMRKIHQTPKYSEPLQSSIDDVKNNLNYFTGFTNLEKNNEDPTPSSFSENFKAGNEKPMGIFAKFQQVLKYNDSNLPQSSVQNYDNTYNSCVVNMPEFSEQKISEYPKINQVVEHEEVEDKLAGDLDKVIEFCGKESTLKESITNREIKEDTMDNKYKSISVKEETTHFVCEKCKKLFVTKGGLLVHNKMIHQGIQYSCENCDYKDTRKANLKVHMESIHEGVYYSCDNCDYKATLKSSLRKHLYTIHKELTKTCRWERMISKNWDPLHRYTIHNKQI